MTKKRCRRLSQHVEVDQILNIRPVSLADYKVIMHYSLEKSKAEFSIRDSEYMKIKEGLPGGGPFLVSGKW